MDSVVTEIHRVLIRYPQWMTSLNTRDYESQSDMKCCAIAAVDKDGMTRKRTSDEKNDLLR